MMKVKRTSCANDVKVGAVQEVRGNAQVTWGKSKDAAKDGAKAVDKALGR
jgi:uncharacterized protein YjbJ (UPF0337 family)